jgi:hypothetical protein
MTNPPRDDASLRPVWIAFAEHFLDNETRHDLPLAALAAVEAGLTVQEARDIWRREVVPVVGSNLLCITGEWAFWDEEWLVEQIQQVRRQTGVLAWLERHGPDPNRRCWRVIAACMQELLSVEPDRRVALARDLHALACPYFEMRNFVPHPLDLARRDELRRVFREVFAPIFAEVVYAKAGASRAAARRASEARVEAALGAGPGTAAR